MATDSKERVGLEFEPRLDRRKFERDVAASEKAFSKRFGIMSKATKKLTDATKKLGDGLKKWRRDATRQNDAQDRMMRDSLAHAEELVDLEERLVRSYGKERREIEKEIEVVQERYKVGIRGAKDYVKTLQMAKVAAMKLRQEEEERKFSKIAETVGYGGRQAGEDLAESFVDALSSVSGRDVFGFASSVVKGMGAAGKYLEGAGLRMQAKGMESGGAGGKALGAIGGILGKIGPILNFASKLGPIVTTLSSVLVGIVKILIDADAAAKDFNKEVLATAGSAGFMARNFDSAVGAASDLESTLRDMYDAATSLDNLRWGISKETHTAVISSLTAEGVAIDKMATYFEDVKNGAATATGYVKDWGSMVQMSVAFSRAFGVSLGEIGQFQGEMMTEMGMNFDMVKGSFQRLLDGARESGIASNKFFAIIRGISSDMSLFNLRMADAAKLLGQIGKVMSPRNAAQFMQTITHMFKGMGLMDRTKSTLLGGKGKTTDLLQRDLNTKIDGLAEDIDTKLGKGTGEELKKVIKKPKDLMKWMAKQGDKLDGATRDKLDGATREALLDASRMSSKLTKGGLVDVASALKDASPMAAMDHLDDIAKNFFKKPVEDLSDVERVAFEQITGVNDEQLDQLTKFKASLDLTKETLVGKLEAGTQLTEDETRLLEKLGIDMKANGKDQAEALEKIDARKVWENMSKTQQDELTKAAKTEELNKRVGEFTQTIMDKIGVLVDFVMNQIYNVLIDAVEGIETIIKNPLDTNSLSTSQRKQIRLSKDKDLMDALEKSGGDAAKFRAEMLKSPVYTDVPKIMKQWVEADPTEKMAGPLHDAMNAIVESINTSMRFDVHQIDKARKAMGAAGMSAEQQQKVTDALAQGKDFSKALSESGAEFNKQMFAMKSAVEGFDPAEQAIFYSRLKKNEGLVSSATQQGGGGEQAKAQQRTAGSPDTGGAAPRKALSFQRGDPTYDKKVMDNQVESTQAASDSLAKDLKTSASGVVLNTAFLKNQFGTQMEESVYYGSARALFEYWLYSQTNRSIALKSLQAGMTGRNFGENVVAAMQKSGAAGDQAILDAVQVLRGNAQGGTVLQPAPGEVIASVAPGEHIVPAGGAGGGPVKVVLELKGDMLKQIIRAQAMDTINDHDRRRPLR